LTCFLIILQLRQWKSQANRETNLVWICLNLNTLPQKRQVNPLAWNLMAQDSLICWVIVFNLSHLLWATLALLLTFDPLLLSNQILFGETHSTPFIYIFIFSHKDKSQLSQLAYSSANQGGQRKKQEVIQ